MPFIANANSPATPSDGSAPTPAFQLPATLALAPTATSSPSAASAPLAPKLKTILLTVVPILAVLLAFAIACEVVYLRRRARVRKARHASFGCATAAAAAPATPGLGHARDRGSVSSERTFVGGDGDEPDFKNPDRDPSGVRIVNPYAGLSTPVNHQARPFSSYTFESRASAWFEPFESSFDVDDEREREKTAPLAEDDCGDKERWVMHKNAFLVHDEMDIADHGKM